MRAPGIGLFTSMGGVTGVTLVTLAAYLVAVLLLGRRLEPDAFGRFNLWIYAFNLLGTASLVGFPNAILRHAPRERLDELDWPRWGRLLAPLAAAVSGLGALAFAAIYDLQPIETWLLGAGGAALGLSLWPVTLLQIQRRFVTAQAMFTLWRPVLLGGVLGGIVAAGTPQLRVVLLAVTVGATVQLIWGLRTLREVPHGDVRLPLRPMAGDAVVFAGLFVTAMLILRLDSFALPRLLDFAALGRYSALVTVTLTGYGVVGIAVGQVLSPKLASRERLPWGRLVALIVVGGGTVGALLTAASPWLVPWLFGEAYRGDHRATVALLALAGVLQVLYAIPSSRIGMQARSRALRKFLPVSLSSLVVDAALLIWWVPRYGIAGAAAASAVTWLWRTAWAWWVAARTVPSGDGSPNPSGTDPLRRDGTPRV